jgi:hypothetical protein
MAPSAKRIKVLNYEIVAQGAVSSLTLCALVQNPLWVLGELNVCRSAKAESFIVR